MINSYDIFEINGKKMLVLKLDFYFELGKFSKNDPKNLISMVKDYLNKIIFKDLCDKIILTVSGIVLANIVYTKSGDLKLASNDVIDLDNNTSIVENVEVNDNIDLEDNFNVENSDESVESKSEIDISESFTVEKTENSNNSSSVKTNFNNNPQNNVTNSDKNNIAVNKENNVSKEENNQNKENNQIPDKVEVEESKPEQNSTSEVEKTYVTVYRSNGKGEKIELEEYITGVIAAEMPAAFSKEALKTQAVVARTYALRKVNSGEKLTDTVSTQAYIDTAQMKTKWGSDFSKYYNKIKDCVEATNGEYITYNGEYINAVYHSTSNGYTEDAVNVCNESYPYLKSVESSWDKSVSSYQKYYQRIRTNFRFSGFK